MEKQRANENEATEPVRLESAHLDLPYIPDFLFEDVRFWFAPTFKEPVEVYHELVGKSAELWESSYNTTKGWKFIQTEPRPAEGPFAMDPAGVHLTILEPGKLFAPKPLFRLTQGSPAVPIVSLQKRRPLNPWKPNYIQALNFIKKYEWMHEVPRAVKHAVWEIEECGQVAGSTSWRNAERVLRDLDSTQVRHALADIFFNRPEDCPLGSEVYLRVLGLAGEEGFKSLIELAEHPVSRKRRVVASTLGHLGDRRGLPSLLKLLEDEDPEVRTAALRALGKVGVRPEDDPSGKVAALLDSEEIPRHVWAAQALRKGGDEAQERYLLALAKEEPRLLTDMGELGDVLADLRLVDAVPYLINRLKHPKSEFRADAAEALGKVTGLDLEYQSLDSEEQRRSAIKTYTRWWEEKKKERRLER
ncbi:MAG TPA: HEAT repeat domain-containing protein [Planctomycetota bacterium]|nr:HEAT repeat domain-containing protein [Planctomycetota bacterium]